MSDIGLPPEEIIRRIEIALAEGGGTHTWEDMKEGLIKGDLQIFWNEHGACITEIIQTPQLRYLHCWIVAGELPGVMDLQDQVERHALSSTCEYMETKGRLGWEKVLPDYGWKKSMTVFTKKIEGV